MNKLSEKYENKIVLINNLPFFEINGKNLLLNYISGACDVIDEHLKTSLLKKKYTEISSDNIKKLMKRKYIFSSKKEYQNYISKLDIQLEMSDQNCYPNFVLIPSYGYNLCWK